MTVILIDDEQVAVNALKRRVDWEKYGIDQVLIAGSMKQAQEVFRREHIDAMLCDIEMPQGSGLELYEWVKIYYPQVECIYVTCHPEYEYMRRAMQLGSADYILKPIDYQELDRVLTELAQRRGKAPVGMKIPESIVMQEAKLQSERSKDKVVNQVKRYILEHIQETIYISDIANMVYLNEQYLMRIFKKETGVSILEHITEERIRLAQELLSSTDFAVKQVADLVGYGNYSYFTKIFKRNVGMTPLAYRQAARGEAQGEEQREDCG